MNNVKYNHPDHLGALICGQVTLLPHPDRRGHFILPGGRVASRRDAEAAAKRLNYWLTQQSSRNLTIRNRRNVV